MIQTGTIVFSESTYVCILSRRTLSDKHIAFLPTIGMTVPPSVWEIGSFVTWYFLTCTCQLYIVSDEESTSPVRLAQLVAQLRSMRSSLEQKRMIIILPSCLTLRQIKEVDFELQEYFPFRSYIVHHFLSC